MLMNNNINLLLSLNVYTLHNDNAMLLVPWLATLGNQSLGLILHTVQ